MQLWAWQKFIDTFPDVEVTTVSRNTIPLTPRLIRMARDVNAFRRSQPTDAEWVAETANDAQLPPPVPASSWSPPHELRQ